MTLTRHINAALLGATALTSPVFADAATEGVELIETITVTGYAGGVEEVAGSVTFISAEDLARQTHSDILRVLRTVPGVNLQEEEGYGLRPNIGLRGSGSDRNSRVVVMEDGVPIAPAVYAAPSAYYFPATTRMSAVEIVKGPAVIQYGPRTTGGAIHLFSTPLPGDDGLSGFSELFVGDFGRSRLHAHLGGRTGLGEATSGAFLLETYQDAADGFLTRDNGGDTGFDIEDYVVKLGLDGALDGRDWALGFKYQTKDETSEQTYQGLTRADFAADPYRLYASTAEDVMDNDNALFQLTGQLDISDRVTLTAIGYHNDFARNWYKMQGVNAAGKGAAGDVGIADILDDPVTYAAELALLRGEASLDDSLVLRANNREYETRGVSLVLDADVTFAGFDHNLSFGARLHEDSEDRLQFEDAYRLDNGTMIRTTAGAPGSQANRLTEAEARAFYVINTVDVSDRLQVTGGVRVEDYEITRLDFAGNDPDRAQGPTSSRSAGNTVVLPSLSALFMLDDDWTLLAGIHRGFSPVGATSGNAEDEFSTNLEAGLRYAARGLSVEAIAYLNDYENLLGQCTNSTGGSCTPGDAFNGGEFTARGIEVQAASDAADWLQVGGLKLPVSASYTFTNTEFETSFNNDFFGVVASGDELNYVPRHQWALSAGIIGARWGADAVVTHVGEARGTIGSGSIAADDRIDARTLVDAAAYLDITGNVRATVKAENLFDETYIAALRPAGVRPGKPREVLFGLQIAF